MPCNLFDRQVTASGNVCGHISNPLLVLPLQSTVAMEFPPRSMEPEPSSNLVGAGYQSFEESILKKLQKVCILLKDVCICLLGVLIFHMYLLYHLRILVHFRNKLLEFV